MIRNILPVWPPNSYKKTLPVCNLNLRCFWFLNERFSLDSLNEPNSMVTNLIQFFFTCYVVELSLIFKTTIQIEFLCVSVWLLTFLSANCLVFSLSRQSLPTPTRNFSNLPIQSENDRLKRLYSVMNLHLVFQPNSTGHQRPWHSSLLRQHQQQHQVIRIFFHHLRKDPPSPFQGYGPYSHQETVFDPFPYHTVTCVSTLYVWYCNIVGASFA